MFENGVQGRIFGPERDEGTGEQRKLHNEELNDLYCSPNTTRAIRWRRMRCAGHVAWIGKRRAAFGVSVPVSQGKRPLGRPKHRWEDNVKTDLQEVGWWGM